MNLNKNFPLSILAVALLALLGAGVSAPVAAKNETKASAAKSVEKAEKTEKPDSTPIPASNPDWQLRCQDLKEGDQVTGKYCEAVQSLYVVQTDKDSKKTNTQRIAELAVGYPPGRKGKTAQAVVILPLGIIVNEKIMVEVDGSGIDKIETRFCDNGGCVALFELDKGALAKMSKGKEISFRTKSAANQPVFIGLPLSAFGTVLEQIAPKK